MKTIIVLLVPLLLLGFFFFQGVRSARIKAPQITSAKLPACGSKPNCVCSEQAPSDSHYIEPIALKAHSIESAAKAIESIGGVVVSRDTNSLQATFTSSIFRFVDDVLLRIDGDQIHIRSSSRVGHSDLGANRKRVQRLQQILS